MAGDACVAGAVGDAAERGVAGDRGVTAGEFVAALPAAAAGAETGGVAGRGASGDVAAILWVDSAPDAVGSALVTGAEGSACATGATGAPAVLKASEAPAAAETAGFCGITAAVCVSASAAGLRAGERDAAVDADAPA